MLYSEMRWYADLSELSMKIKSESARSMLEDRAGNTASYHL